MSRSAIFLYTGEFGYELLSFQGILRKHKKEFIFDQLYVCSYPDREIFYRDFVDKFIPYPETILRQFRPAYNIEEFPTEPYIQYLKDNKIITPLFDIYVPANPKYKYGYYDVGCNLDLTGVHGLYIDFPNSREIKSKNIISIFPRNHTVHDFRNYNVESFKRFILELKKNLPEYEVKIVMFDDKYNAVIDLNRYESSRISVIMGDQGSKTDLKRVAQMESFDLIIDDGSHLWNHQIDTFKELFGIVKGGGIYIVEDVCTSYWPTFSGGSSISCINYFKELVDDINFKGHQVDSKYDRRESSLIEDLKKRHLYNLYNDIDHMAFYNSTIVIYKRK